MLHAQAPSLIFSNAITNEVFDAVTEARTKNRDILLITYRGSIHESCSEFFTYIKTLRDPCSSSLNPSSPASTTTQKTVSADESISIRTNNKCDSCNSNYILFRCRARDIILSTTFIFIGRSTKKELYQFQNEMLQLNHQKNEEKNILTGALSFLSPLFPGTPHAPVRTASVHMKSKQRKKTLQTRRLSQKEEDHSWFRLVKDSDALICNRLEATMPPSWWGEDPTIIPTINLVSANGSLNPIYVGKTDTSDNDDQDGFNAFGLGGRQNNNERPQTGPFPCHDVLECLIEERIKRAKRVYKWCLHAKKEFQMVESKCIFDLDEIIIFFFQN